MKNVNKTINPIEMLRFKHNLSQLEFGNTLGYNKVETYRTRINSINREILDRIYDAYGVNLIYEVIAYLNYCLNQYKQKDKQKEKASKQQPPAPKTNNNADQLKNLIK